MAKITLGIDPGSFITGFGVVTQKPGGDLQCLGFGTVEGIKKGTPLQRLLQIGEGVNAVLEKYKPHAIALEKVFFAKNADSAIKLGQARGVILYEAAKAKVEVFEYTPTEIKASLVNYGKASKEQVQFMVQTMLGIPQIEKLDSSDALALAIHHARIARTNELILENEARHQAQLTRSR